LSLPRSLSEISRKDLTLYVTRNIFDVTNRGGFGFLIKRFPILITMTSMAAKLNGEVLGQQALEGACT
jgi:hypothetical protein